MKTNFRRMKPSAVLIGLLLTLPLVSLADKKGKPNDNSVSMITATFSDDCISVEAQSTKDLSNVVLLFTDGTWEKFDDLDGPTGIFAGTLDNDNVGKAIAIAFVKSGSFKMEHMDVPVKVGNEFSCDEPLVGN